MKGKKVPIDLEDMKSFLESYEWLRAEYTRTREKLNLVERLLELRHLQPKPLSIIPDASQRIRLQMWGDPNEGAMRENVGASQ